MTRYAAGTDVSVDRSKAEIEAILRRYGAEQFVSGWSADQALIGFSIATDSSIRQVRFGLSMPRRTDKAFTGTDTGRDQSASAAEKAWEQACRQRWRALAPAIKAKLEAVDSGISEFEDEFMANIVMSDGRSVSEHVRPWIADAYATGNMQALLPDLRS